MPVCVNAGYRWAGPQQAGMQAARRWAGLRSYRQTSRLRAYTYLLQSARIRGPWRAVRTDGGDGPVSCARIGKGKYCRKKIGIAVSLRQ